MSEQEKKPCDTHFAGFAKLLMDELLAVDDGRIDVSSYNAIDDEMIEMYRAIIARRAYDLVVHAVSYAANVNPEYAKKLVEDVPDLTELPEGPEE